MITVYAVLMSATLSASPGISRLLDAMEQVESGGNVHAVGDGGRSHGPLQIQRPYWIDSNMPGTFSQVRDRKYARATVIAYWKRYSPAAYRTEDVRTLARIHNGGPAGHTKTATIKYWDKVNRELNRTVYRRGH